MAKPKASFYLNRFMRLKHVEESKPEPNQEYLNMIDQALTEILDEQAMEGVVHIYYKVNPDTGCMIYNYEQMIELVRIDNIHMKAHMADYF